MRQIFHHTLIVLFALVVAACSGGNSLDGTSTGGTAGGTTPVVKVTLTLVNNSDVAINQISTKVPGRLLALVTIDGVEQVGAKVDFSLLDGVGELTNTSALTGSNGIAEVELKAGTVENAGTAQAIYNDESAQVVFNVTVSVVDTNVEVNMSAITTTPNSIGANGTASLSITMTETNNGTVSPLSQSIAVEFTSDCSILDLATIDTNVTTSNGIATATYQDQGCGREDTIRAKATVGQQQFLQEVALNVVGAELGSIEFKSATPSVIALKGTGGISRSETSSLVFVVKDVIGNVVRDAAVNFSLNTDVGGITISPEAQAKTNSDGEVTVIVAAGSVPTAVIVSASLDINSSIATISSSLSISTGVVDSNSFSISADNLSPEGWNIDGTEVNIIARLADHFNNPVPDGTAVNFSAEFGAIEPQCLTVSGACTVTWNSQSPRVPDPAYRDVNAVISKLGASTCDANDGGSVVSDLGGTELPCPGKFGSVFGNRTTIFAYTLGEESFNDANSNGRFDSGEAYTDLSEAFRDENEDGYFSALLADGSATPGAVSANDITLNNVLRGGDNEEYIDFNTNQRFDAPNNLYNGTLCNNDNEECSTELVTIGKNIVILQAGSKPYISFIEVSDDLSIWKKDSYNQDIYLYDAPAPITSGPTETATTTVETTTNADGVVMTPTSTSTSTSIEVSGITTTTTKTTTKIEIVATTMATVTTTVTTTTVTTTTSIRITQSRNIKVYVADVHNGFMPAGTTISFETSNGTIEGQSAFTIVESNRVGIYDVTIVLKPDDEIGNGSLTVTITTPDGITTRQSIGVFD